MVNAAIQDPAMIRGLLETQGIRIAWFSLGSAPLIEIAGQSFNVGLIDLQHGLWDRQGAHLAIGVLDVPSIVRSADSSHARIGEALDSGAAGVLVPAIENADQARAIVNASLYPSAGSRSGGGVQPLSRGFDQYYRRCREPVIGAMIESVEAARNAEAIARVPGIDFLFIGTGNLALSLGCFPQVDDRLEKECRAIFEACRRAEKPCGIFTGSAAWARQKLIEGYRAVVVADDVSIVRQGFAAAGQEAVHPAFEHSPLRGGDAE